MHGHQRAEDVQEPGQSQRETLFHNCFRARPFPFPTPANPSTSVLHKGRSQVLEAEEGTQNLA